MFISMRVSLSTMNLQQQSLKLDAFSRKFFMLILNTQIRFSFRGVIFKIFCRKTFMNSWVDLS